MFNSAGVGMIATDRELRIRAWNPAAMRIFGASAAQMTGTDVASIVPQPRRQLARRLLNRALELGETNELEFQQRDERGESRELAIAITPIASDQGQTFGALICVRDITRRVRAVSALHESEKMVALGEMAGAVSHHFNNILGGVVTSVDFALAGDDDAVARQVLEKTARALARATQLMRGLLAFAEGNLSHQDQCDFSELLINLTDRTERRIANRGIVVTLELPHLPVMSVPRDALENVIENLVQNAISAMPHGGTLTIAGACHGDTLRIQVRDSGFGMTPQELQRCFEPFYRVAGNRSADPPTQARGLGLAVAFGIVRNLGGSITARSEPDRGSCFEVTIPRSLPH
ncbi:MAG: PAS domain S-box protein [Phycisphaerales bacterium]|nr:MAG: PAS domain S-box protein [Phycisphaerales bacterium]